MIIFFLPQQQQKKRKEESEKERENFKEAKSLSIYSYHPFNRSRIAAEN